MSEKRAAIVGGSSGLGLGTAAVFVENGFEVILGGRDTSKLARAAAELGSSASGIAIDVKRSDSVVSFFAGIGQIQHLVITASGSFADKPLQDSSIDEIKEFADTKLWGAARCVQAARQNIVAGGSITLVSGAVSQRGRAGAHAKTIVNCALEGLTRSLSAEFGPAIRVNCVSPSIFDSKGTMTQARREELSKQYPAAYVGSSRDVAQIVCAIAMNPFMTGAVTFVDGGWTAA